MTQNPELQPDGTYGPVPLSKKPEGPQPLPIPEVKPLPERPFYYPFNSVEEYVAALKDENDRLVTELENAQLRQGKIPIGLVWWKYLAGGVGASLIGFFLRGCL